MQRKTIVYIAGAGRSGSTILDLILSEGKGIISLGEFRQFWKTFIKKRALCSCNKSYCNCELWRYIIKDIFGKYEFNETEIDYYYNIQKIIERTPILNSIKQKKYFKTFHREIQEYIEFMREIYDKVFIHTRNPIIIDSSKLPHYLLILKKLPFEIKLIHLIRDPRGVAYSWTKSKFDFSINDYMKRHHPFTSSRMWIFYNLAIERLKSYFDNRTLLKYEDFCLNPKQAIQKIYKDLNLPYFNMPNIANNKIVVFQKEKHLIGGNPVRFSLNEILINEDREWIYNLSIKHKILVTIMTLPFLLKYKYMIIKYY